MSSYHILSSSVITIVLILVFISCYIPIFTALTIINIISLVVNTLSALFFIITFDIFAVSPEAPLTLSRPSLQVHPVFPLMSMTVYIIGPLGILLSLCVFMFPL